MKSKIGQIADENDIKGTRDAVHVPVVIVSCDDVVYASEDVRFTDDTYLMVERCKKENRHAIVDPFLTLAEPGQNFLVMLVPDAVTKLVHHYELDFKDVKKSYKNDSEEDDSCRGCY